jgi:hypothetical protein
MDPNTKESEGFWPDPNTEKKTFGVGSRYCYKIKIINEKSEVNKHLKENKKYVFSINSKKFFSLFNRYRNTVDINAMRASL